MHFIPSPKLFLFSRHLRFSPDFFAIVGKRFDKKGKVNFKIYDVTTWLKNNYNTQYTIPNISLSKSNQAMKLGQLIEYNNKNIFLQKLHRK